MHSVDEQDLSLAAGGFPRSAHHHAGFHGRVIKKVWSEAEHTFEEVQLDKLSPHRRFFVAEEHTVREENCAAAGLWVKALEDVLEEGVVGAALRRRAEEVAAPGVVLPRLAVPLLDRVRRIGEDHVESP